MKVAVHFGAGNIGRGFIGFLLSRAGYQVVFVDVDEALIEALNREGSYRVVEKGDEQKFHRVEGVEGLLVQDEERVAEKISEARLVTTAVGPGNLKSIAPVIARGISRRLKLGPEPLNVIACENLVGASTFLGKKVMECLSAEERREAEKIVGFPDAAVDRIIPPQEKDFFLDVAVEPYFEWVVDAGGFAGEIPSIPGVKFVNNVRAYVERKIYTLNTGHAVAAYLGYARGFSTILDALRDDGVFEAVKGAMEESGAYLTARFGFDRKQHGDYIQNTLKRFLNPALKDPVVRVGRNPLRKLSPEERLVYPALRAQELGLIPSNLCRGIAAALRFDYEKDEEAVRLQAMIGEEGVDRVLEKVCGIVPENPLSGIIKGFYEKSN